VQQSPQDRDHQTREKPRKKNGHPRLLLSRGSSDFLLRLESGQNSAGEKERGEREGIRQYYEGKTGRKKPKKPRKVSKSTSNSPRVYLVPSSSGLHGKTNRRNNKKKGGKQYRSLAGRNSAIRNQKGKGGGGKRKEKGMHHPSEKILRRLSSSKVVNKGGVKGIKGTSRTTKRISGPRHGGKEKKRGERTATSFTQSSSLIPPGNRNQGREGERGSRNKLGTAKSRSGS